MARGLTHLRVPASITAEVSYSVAAGYMLPQLLMWNALNKIRKSIHSFRTVGLRLPSRSTYGVEKPQSNLLFCFDFVY